MVLRVLFLLSQCTIDHSPKQFFTARPFVERSGVQAHIECGVGLRLGGLPQVHDKSLIHNYRCSVLCLCQL